MPRRRWKLTTREEREYATRAQQLCDMGVAIEVPEAPPPMVDIEIGCGHSFIFNSSPLHLTLVTGARIVSRRTGIYLTDEVCVTLTWSVPVFELSYDNGSDERQYRVSPHLSFDREQVLNDQLAAGMRLQRGKIVSGLLVLIGQGQLPEEYHHGAAIDVELTLFDSLGTELNARAVVRVDRNLEVKREIRAKTVPESSSLWEPLPPKPAIRASGESAEKWLAELDRLTECTRRMAARAEKNGARPV